MGTTKWTIYCHTHIESGRRYIGLTKQTMEQRWWKHLSEARRLRGRGCAHFWNAINKYGENAFSHQILEFCDSLDSANRAEAAWIESFSTRNPDFGFNLMPGGEQRPHPNKTNPWLDPDFATRVSASVKKTFATPKSKAIRKQVSTNLWSTPEFRSKVTDALVVSQSDPEIRARMTKGMKKRYEDPDERSKNAALWQDPEYRAKCSSGLALGTAKNKNKTHCKNGHEFTAKDTYVNKSGFRACNVCRRERRMKKINNGLCECGRPRDSHTQRCISCVIKHENHRQSRLAS